MNKEIKEALKIIEWSFTDDGWQDGDDGILKPSSMEIDAMEKVLQHFSKLESNLIIKWIKELKELDYEIELDENQDEFGEHIEYYYGGHSECIEFLTYDDPEDKLYFLFKKALKALNALKGEQ